MHDVAGHMFAVMVRVTLSPGAIVGGGVVVVSENWPSRLVRKTIRAVLYGTTIATKAITCQMRVCEGML